MSKHVVIGTAGHIDHGKTSLVEALTGVNADRWEEERRRGITIDLGFAHLGLSDQLQLDFIDVPGHERFVKNMLAGAGGIDLALLVVAADESIMPQTREHFDICCLLGIRRGVIALTKSDLVEPDLVELVRLEVEDLVEGSFLKGAPIVPVSAKTGAGITELKEALAETASQAEAKNSRRRFRLPVDRVFVMKGFGTVVTGTLISGRVSVDDEVEIHPIGKKARVRGLQSSGETLQRIGAGRRTAVNLSGVDADELARGMVLSEPGAFSPTQQIDCRLNLLPGAPPLKHGAPVHFHLGAAEVEARVFLLERDSATGAPRKTLRPGSSGWVQIRLEDPVLALAGDRFVVRRFSPVVTIGGGEIVDPLAPRRDRYERRRERLEALAGGNVEKLVAVLARQAKADVSAADAVARTGILDAEFNEAALSLEKAGTLVRTGKKPLRAAHAENLEAASDRLTDRLAEFHKKNPLLPGEPLQAARSRLATETSESFGETLLGRLQQQGRIVVESEVVRLADHQITMQEDEEAARRKILDSFEKAGLHVPSLKEFLPQAGVDETRAKRILANLLREKRLVRVADDWVFHQTAFDALLAKLNARKQTNPAINVGDFKDLAGVSRKYAIPLLEYLDRMRITRREGDQRRIL